MSEVKNKHTLINFLETNLSIKVACGPREENECDTKTKIITISTKQSVDKQIYTIIHELGHILLYKEDKKRYKERLVHGYNLLYKKTVPQKPERAKRHLVDIIREEVLCWEKGLDLIEKEKIIKIDKQKYLNYARKCIWSYMEWCLSKIQRKNEK